MVVRSNWSPACKDNTGFCTEQAKTQKKRRSDERTARELMNQGHALKCAHFRVKDNFYITHVLREDVNNAFGLIPAPSFSTDQRQPSAGLW